MDVVTGVELECSYGAGDGRARSGVASMPKERSGGPRLDWSCNWEKYGYDRLQEAARSVQRTDENETLAITQAVEGNMTVRAANSLTASKNAKLDHCLTYAEYMFAKNHFLTAIENAKWGNEALDAFNWFFHNLDNHQLREEGDRGERALLHYASRVRLDWHDKLALGKAYNIGIINEELLAKVARELDARDVKNRLDQARPPPPFSSLILLT